MGYTLALEKVALLLEQTQPFVPIVKMPTALWLLGLQAHSGPLGFLSSRSVLFIKGLNGDLWILIPL